MEAELEAYEYQLSQVKLGLESDPGNAELTSLQAELEEIIDLTKQAIGGPGVGGSGEGSTATTSKSNKKNKDKGFKAGEEVSARYKDMKWYPARITAISGPSDSQSYTLIFKGYTTPITLPASCLKPISEQPIDSPSLAPGPSSSGGPKRKLSAVEEEREKEKRRKKNEKWSEKQRGKVEETLSKKSAWESFGKKAAKKGVKIGGLEGKSIFRTPDNPTGKVGVVGSGQGVTSYDKMGKHKLTPLDNGKNDRRGGSGGILGEGDEEAGVRCRAAILRWEKTASDLAVGRTKKRGAGIGETRQRAWGSTLTKTRMADLDGSRPNHSRSSVNEEQQEQYDDGRSTMWG